MEWGIIMVKSIVKDVLFLGQKSETATPEDVAVVDDLLDTLKANAEHCVGLAANMIGIKKRIIVYSVGMIGMPMINPVIIKKSKPYETEEGCLSLAGVRKTTRFESIEVDYLDRNLKRQKQTFTGWTAQIIQHEIDHCDGIVI
jgi:peptide deformylase